MVVSDIRARGMERRIVEMKDIVIKFRLDMKEGEDRKSLVVWE